jgi:SPP1 gp7 family putative phage head morphogenesis protein
MSRNYWRRRFLDIANANERSTEAVIAEVNAMNRRVRESLEREITQFVDRYAKNDGISHAQASRLLSRAEQQSWNMTLEQFRSKALEGGFERKLDREYFTSRVSRLQRLQTQMDMMTMELAGGTNQVMERHLLNVTHDTFWRSTTELKANTSLAGNFAMFNQDMAMQLVKQPFYGKHFSERIWGWQRDDLAENLKNVLQRGVVGGHSIPRMVRDMELTMSAASFNVERLIRTESAHLAETATALSYEQMGVEKYEYLATLEDTRTCDKCRGLHEQVFEVSKRSVGVNYPTIHPFCRCTTCPWFEDFDEESVDNDPEMAYNNLKDKIDALDMNTATDLDLIEIGREFNEMFDVASLIGDKQGLKDAFANFVEMGGEVPKDGWAKGSTMANRERLNEAFSFYPKKWATLAHRKGKKIFTQNTSRGFFSQHPATPGGRYKMMSDDAVTIHLSGRNTVAWHEVGHLVDHFKPENVRIASAFLDRRTAGNVQRKLNGGGMTRFGGFIDDYVGREYLNADGTRRSSEVLTIGLEALFVNEQRGNYRMENATGQTINKNATILDDEEFFNLISGFILGG